MAEYIEREKAIEEIDSWLDSVGSIIVGKGLSSYGELIGCIQDVPTADVAEVKHGKWINIPRHKSISGDWLKAQACSACGAFYVRDGNKPCSNHKYCPNCGARMDGEEE